MNIIIGIVAIVLSLINFLVITLLYRAVDNLSKDMHLTMKAVNAVFGVQKSQTQELKEYKEKYEKMNQKFLDWYSGMCDYDLKLAMDDANERYSDFYEKLLEYGKMIERRLTELEILTDDIAAEFLMGEEEDYDGEDGEPDEYDEIPDVFEGAPEEGLDSEADSAESGPQYDEVQGTLEEIEDS